MKSIIPMIFVFIIVCCLWLRVATLLRDGWHETIGMASVGGSNADMGVHVEPYTSITLAVVATVVFVFGVVKDVMEYSKKKKEHAQNK